MSGHRRSPIKSLADSSILFLSHSASGDPDLELAGVGLGPNTQLDAHYVEPLSDVCGELIVCDLGREYALRGPSAANAEVLDLALRRRPDYVLWHAMAYELLRPTISAMREAACRVIGWFSDDEFRFDDYTRGFAPFFDWCLTTDESVLWAYGALGTGASRMMWGSNERVFRRLGLPPTHDVSFVGRLFGTRGRWVEDLRKGGLDVAAYGRGWPAGYISEDRLVEVFNTSRVNLCFVGADGLDAHRPVLKGRVFDVCMCGGFLLCEHVPGIEEFFEPDREIALFRDLEEAREKIAYYLAHEDERLAVAAAGMRRAQRDHTQAARFREAFSTMRAAKSAEGSCSAHVPASRLPARVRAVDAQWHYDWARGLEAAGYPRWRIREELELCLSMDPAHRGARRQRALLSVPSPLDRAAATAKQGVVDARRALRDTVRANSAARIAWQRMRSARDSERVSKMARGLQRDVETAPFDVDRSLFDGALDFVGRMRMPGTGVGAYRYSPSTQVPLLYASVYAAMLRHLLGDLGQMSQEQKSEWGDYINSHQCQDGLYRDPRLASALAEREDWWGWRHLTAHVVTALTCLDARPLHGFSILEPLYGPGAATEWVSSLDWCGRPDCASNAVMNYGVLLQYERDFRDCSQAAAALLEVLDYLEATVDTTSGLWGPSRSADWESLSIAVQTSYHIWNLFFFDGRPIPHAERAVDSCLRLQNRLGGFSPRPNASACEDIDAMDALARLATRSEHPEDVQVALKAAVKWTWANRVGEGGLVFRRHESFHYGHELMTTGPDEPNLFATWFRVLAVAYAILAVGSTSGQEARLQWVQCPGYQFWRPDRVRVGA